jgi:ribosome-binding factor A
MESVRQQKVSRLLQKEIGVIVQQHINHLTHGNMVTITVVRVVPDLGFAKIYASVFPSDTPQSIIDSLNEHSSEVTRLLYPRIRHQFRKMPEIRFYLDDSLDEADRLNEILPG